MVTLSPQQKAANTRKRNKFLKALKEKQEMFRNDPKALAAAIAENIRTDNHPNENPEEYQNGAMHWHQLSWGQFRFDPSAINLIRDNQFSAPLYEVSCPTTGCVAGWATTLAGYPMVFSSYDVKEDFSPGEIIEIGDCHINGERASIVDTAANLLDLGTTPSRWLFDGYNSQEQVLWALDQISAGRYLRVENCPFDQDGNRIDGEWIDGELVS